MMAISTRRISASTINKIMMIIGLSSPPQLNNWVIFLNGWNPPTKQTVDGGKQSQLQSQLPPAPTPGPGVGT